jgi:hypothetical protein
LLSSFVMAWPMIASSPDGSDISATPTSHVPTARQARRRLPLPHEQQRHKQRQALQPHRKPA